MENKNIDPKMSSKLLYGWEVSSPRNQDGMEAVQSFLF